jgi:uncharacterized membrane protein
MYKNSILDQYALKILCCITILGSFLRFYGLNIQSLWVDELSSWYRSSWDNIYSVIFMGHGTDTHPPGYQILLYFIEKYIGESEVILRFPSALGGVLSIIMIFIVGTKIYSHREGLIAAALLAVSYTPIYFSQEARSYSLLILSTLVSTYFCIEILKNISLKARLNYSTICSYCIIAIITCYLHYFGILLIFLQCKVMVLYSLNKRYGYRAIILICLTIVLSYAPWIPTMWKHFQIHSMWIPTPSIKEFIYFIEFFVGDSRLFAGIFLVLLFLLMITGCHHLIKHRDNITFEQFIPSILLLLWLFVPFILVYIYSLIATPILSHCNLLISLPAAYILFAHAIIKLPISSKKQGLLVVTIGCLAVYHLLFIKHYYTRPCKPQFRDAVEFILKRDNFYRDSVIIGCGWVPYYFDYYFKQKGSTKRVSEILAEKEDIVKLDAVTRKNSSRYIWYIRGFRTPNKVFLNYLEKNFSLIEHQIFYGAEVWCWKPH